MGSTSTMTTADAVVVGAGPNGLVAANALVDAGWETYGLSRSGTTPHPDVRPVQADLGDPAGHPVGGRGRDGLYRVHDQQVGVDLLHVAEDRGQLGLGGQVQLLDPHRVMITGPTPKWRAAEVMCPPALRPGVVILLGMLAAPGTSVLRNVYVINRGYEDLAERLNALGAHIETFRDI